MDVQYVWVFDILWLDEILDVCSRYYREWCWLDEDDE